MTYYRCSPALLGFGTLVNGGDKSADGTITAFAQTYYPNPLVQALVGGAIYSEKPPTGVEHYYEGKQAEEKIAPFAKKCGIKLTP